MFFKLLILFVGVPLLEISVLIKMGAMIGFWPTFLIQVGTGALGASLARFQGFLVLRKAQNELQMGRLPTGAVLDGVLILLAGLVLLTPGLLTDAAGFLVLLPWTRRLFREWLYSRFESKIREAVRKSVVEKMGKDWPPQNEFMN